MVLCGVPKRKKAGKEIKLFCNFTELELRCIAMFVRCFYVV